MVLGVECDAGFRFNVGGWGWLEGGGGVCDACTTAAAATPTSLCLFSLGSTDFQLSPNPE